MIVFDLFQIYLKQTKSYLTQCSSSSSVSRYFLYDSSSNKSSSCLVSLISSSQSHPSTSALIEIAYGSSSKLEFILVIFPSHGMQTSAAVFTLSIAHYKHSLSMKGLLTYYRFTLRKGKTIFWQVNMDNVTKLICGILGDTESTCFSNIVEIYPFVTLCVQSRDKRRLIQMLIIPLNSKKSRWVLSHHACPKHAVLSRWQLAHQSVLHKTSKHFFECLY